jgi:hypothetical protein
VSTSARRPRGSVPPLDARTTVPLPSVLCSLGVTYPLVFVRWLNEFPELASLPILFDTFLLFVWPNACLLFFCSTRLAMQTRTRTSTYFPFPFPCLPCVASAPAFQLPTTSCPLCPPRTSTADVHLRGTVTTDVFRLRSNVGL